MLGKYVDKFNKKDKFFLVGYNNAAFDNLFLRGFFLQNKNNYFGSWFWSSSLDVMVLATLFLAEKRADMENFKLSTVATTLGIKVEEEKLHDASYDIYLTKSIFNIITKWK
jgi:DNA polymerase-3 subunit epsilon